MNIDIQNNPSVSMTSQGGATISVSTPDNVLQGPRGYSAYEIAVQNGFKGTETEFLESLRGPQEPQGEQGEQGKQGVRGATGNTGSVGPQGIPGVSPTIEVKENTEDTYILEITDSTGTFDTPNLKGPKGDSSGGLADSIDYKDILNKPLTDLELNEETNLSDIPNGSYMIIKGNRILANESMFVDVTKGNIIFKNENNCVILCLTGNYFFYTNLDKWIGNYCPTLEEVNNAIADQVITLAEIQEMIDASNSVIQKNVSPRGFPITSIEPGIYAVSNIGTTGKLKVNVLGSDITYNIKQHTLIIKDYDNNVTILGTENIIFRYDAINSYYNEPIDLMNIATKEYVKETIKQSITDVLGGSY